MPMLLALSGPRDGAHESLGQSVLLRIFVTETDPDVDPESNERHDDDGNHDRLDDRSCQGVRMATSVNESFCERPPCPVDDEREESCGSHQERQGHRPHGHRWSELLRERYL